MWKSGLSCQPSSVSRVENGHTVPTLPVLERWAKALDAELYQIFFVGHGEHEALKLPDSIPMRSEERTLLGLSGQMDIQDKSLLVSLTRDLVERIGKLG